MFPLNVLSDLKKSTRDMIYHKCTHTHIQCIFSS